jgi:tRNA(Ile)-lysidine synthase
VLRISAARPRRPGAAFEYLLDVPGEVRIAETDAVLRASIVTGPERPLAAEGWDAVAALQASAVSLPLTVRSRRPGDRFTPLGAPGRRSLQDLLVDRKVPRGERLGVPVVVDADGRIVWVAPLAVAERCRVRRPEAGMVILAFKKGTP